MNFYLDDLRIGSSHSTPDEEWSIIKRFLFPGVDQLHEGIADNTRRSFDGMLWLCKTGAPWRDLPEDYGKWNSVYRRFRRWAAIGTLDNVAKSLRKEIGAKQYISESVTLERRAYRKVMKIREMMKADRKRLTFDRCDAL
jgi:transposase